MEELQYILDVYVNGGGIVPRVFGIASSLTQRMTMKTKARIRAAGPLAALWIATMAFPLVSLRAGAQDAPYRDPKLAVEQRVSDLLGRMTLEEKIAQLEGAWENRQFFSDPKALFIDEK